MTLYAPASMGIFAKKWLATVTRFEELEIWQQAHELYLLLLPLVKKIKDNHDYRFADQLKAAAGSIMDNIAEGFEKEQPAGICKFFKHFQRRRRRSEIANVSGAGRIIFG